jgi:amino acid adenylation domain-containing protein/thioester reductase-like protein
MVKYYPLTHPQKSIWNVEKFYNDTTFGNIAGPVIFNEKVNLLVLEKAINIFVQQNDSVRLILSEGVEKPRQYFAEYHKLKIDRFDFANEDGLKEFESWVDRQTKIPFKTTDSELFYFALINLGDHQGGFYLNFHHLICDAWSMTLSVRQIADNYWKLMNNLPIEFTSKPSYIDYILDEQEYQRSEKFLAHKDFWDKKFDAVPQLTTFRARKTIHTTKANRKTFVLSTEITNEINSFCNEHKISIYMLFFSILAVYMYRVTSKQDMVIGTPVLNRKNHKQKNTVGMFISNVPVRTYVDYNLEFQDFLKVTLKEWKQILRYQQYPYDLLLKSYRHKHKGSENLIDVSISYQNARFDIENIEYKAKWHFNGSTTESLSIHISDREDEGRLSIDFDYLQDLFTEDEIERMNEHLLNLLTDAIQYPYKKLSSLKLLSVNESNQLLCDFNQTSKDFPENLTIHRLFEEQVEKTPDHIAVVYENEELSYRELNERSNQLARELIKFGVKADAIVAILLNRSIEMVVAMVAILKAGAAYLPIDPEYPRDRIKYVILDSGCEIIVTHSKLAKANYVRGKILYMDRVSLEDNSGSDIKAGVTSCNLAYLIYTSGSTGNPKGVMIEHKSIINTLIWRKEYYGFNTTDSVLQLPSYAFDSSVEDIFTPLISGAKLVLVNQNELLSTTYLGSLIKAHGITNLLIVPSFLRQLLDGLSSELSNLRFITVAGEAVSEGLVHDFFITTNHNVRLFNEYGPTENSVCTTVFEILPNDKRVLIGHPINNNTCYIVDRNWNLVPTGFVGELCVSGVGLARGYFNRPELTEEKFVENPFKAGTRLYPTGDLARWMPDGNIEFIGRIDDQVKIRGFRIELSEIEACITNFPGIKENVVIVNTESIERVKLVAYLVSDKTISISNLKRYLSAKLPKHMIPSAFVFLDALPLTPNGKINRRALPNLEQNDNVVDYEPPHNDIERILVNLWKEVLGVNKVSINDNFFDLGGDSLVIVELLTSLFEYNWNLTAQDFYEYPTIKELVVKILDQGENRMNHQRNLARSVFNHQTILPTGDRGIRNEVEEALNAAKTPVKDELTKSYGQQHSIKRVLLTGATGFLGIHVLAELLSQGITVYCLVRGENPIERLCELLEYYFPRKFLGLLGDDIIVVNGDICKHQFGLDENNYRLLGSRVDIVVHSAALVKHYGDYQEFERVNVLGTQEVVTFCNTFGQRLGHISTVSVAGNESTEMEKGFVFTESDFYFGQNYLNNVYIRSKVEAENILYQSTDLGLKATVFRVGMLMGRYTDGHFQQNIHENAMYNRLRSIIQLKAVPIDILKASLNFTPVDYCAKSIVKVLLTGATEGRVFHLFNHNTVQMRDLINMLATLGLGIQTLSTSEFKQLVENIARDKERKNLLAGLVTDFGQEKTLHYSSSVTVDSDSTQNYLKQLDFEWPTVTAEYLQKLVIHMKAVGYLIAI